MGVEALIADGRAAIAAGRWNDAATAFEQAAEEGEPPEALDGLAEVRYRQGDYTAAITLHERAYAGFRARGDTRYPAVLAGYTLAFEYAAVYGDMAVASGWLERGRKLAQVSGDCVERGWVELACVLATDNWSEKDVHIAAATQIARRFGDRDLEFDALAYAGVLMVQRGMVAEGMRQLDEAAAATQGGEVVGHTAAAEIYCKMLVACELTLDVRRAMQWRDVANRLAERSNVQWASAICRMHYGGILTAAGRWSEAEEELARSVRIYDSGYRALRAGSVVRLADLRVRQGRLEEAEELLDGHDHDSYAVRPLGRVHLLKGEGDVAGTLLRRELAGSDDGIMVVPALALLAEVELAAGRPTEVQEIAARLTAVAERTAVPFIQGLASYVAGVGSTGTAEAAGHLEQALTAFSIAGLPLEQARARLALARWIAAVQPHVAITEAKTALQTFDDLGAAPDADATAAFLRSLGARGRTGPKGVGVLSKREQEVLQLLGLGLTNPEIGQRLFVSRKTAAHHVSNVLAKLGLRNRAEAAVYARDSQRVAPADR